jgi:hypothetical protein
LAAAVVVGTPTALSAARASSLIGAAGGRAIGVVVAAGPDRTVVVRWTPPGALQRDTAVALAAEPPPVGTRTEVAFPPSDPGAALVPGAEVLARVDRGVGTLALIVVVLVVVGAVSATSVLARRRAARRPTTWHRVRRVRVEAGPIARSWLELPGRWIPVHYDPVLTTLPSPAEAGVHGDPARHRLVPVEVGGRTLWPSGPVSAVEPRGRRHGNPSGPDEHAARRAARLDRLGRRLRAVLPLAAPAPVVGLLWAWVDRGGVTTWLATSVLLGALALWWGALRGIDPT